MWWIGRRGIRVMVNMRLWYLRLIKKIFFATATFHLTTTTHLTAIVSTTSNKSKSVMEGLSFPIVSSYVPLLSTPRFLEICLFQSFEQSVQLCLGPSGTLWLEVEFLCPFYLNLELPQDMSVLVFRTFS
jgi:hypothetical protein